MPECAAWPGQHLQYCYHVGTGGCVEWRAGCWEIGSLLLMLPARGEGGGAGTRGAALESKGAGRRGGGGPLLVAG